MESSKPKGGSTAIVIGIFVVLLAGAGAFWALNMSEPKVEPMQAAPADASVARVIDAAAEVEDEELEVEDTGPAPKNAQEHVISVAKRGSSSPELLKWLSSDGIIRRIAAAVRLIADGRSPSALLSFIEVKGRFEVIDAYEESDGKQASGGIDDRVFISDTAYARYDSIASIFTSADVEAWGRGYRQVRPHFEKVFKEVAQPGERFDDVLTRALSLLAYVEVPEGKVELVEEGAIFKYKDAKLEALSDAEKHMLRMGPRNAQALQSVIERFAKAAGLKLVRP